MEDMQAQQFQAIYGGMAQGSASGAERRIVTVADGIAPQDAATLGQLDSAIADLNAGYAAELAQQRAEIDIEINALETELAELGAQTGGLEARLEQRKKQFRLLVHSIREIQRTFDDDEGELTADAEPEPAKPAADPEADDRAMEL